MAPSTTSARGSAPPGARDFQYAPFALEGALHEVYVRRFDVATRFAAGHEFEMRLRALPTVKSGGRPRSKTPPRTPGRKPLAHAERLMLASATDD